MKHIPFLLIVFVFALAACQSQTAEVVGERVEFNGGSYTNVNADELNAMLKNKDFMFVNVHIPFEGNIANTDLSIPYNQIAEASYLSQLPEDKAAKIVLYCRSGRMSQIASEELVNLGYANVWNLKGGMVEWEGAGYSLEEK